MTAHWGVPDPAAVHGSADEVQRAYSAAFSALDRRISLFLSLPLETLDASRCRRPSKTSESNKSSCDVSVSRVAI